MREIRRKKIAAALLLLILAAASAPSSGRAGVDPAARAYYMRGSFLEARGELMLAYSYYVEAARHGAQEPAIRLALARTAWGMNNAEETRRHAEWLIERGFNVPRATMLIAETLYAGGEPAKAAELLEGIRDNEEAPRFDILKFLAKIYLEIEDPAKAADALEKAREIDGSDLFIHYRLGFIYADRGDVEGAISSFARAVETNPGFAGAHLALGSILLHAGRREEAKASLARALEIDPENRNAAVELADLYFEDDQLEEGAALLEHLYAGQKLGESGKMMLGRFYYRLGREEKALGVFRDLLDTPGERPSVMRVVAEIELDRGNHSTAFEYLERLVEISPEDFDNYVGLVLLANDLAGEPSTPEEAVKISPARGKLYLEEAVERMDRSSASDNYIIGTVYRQIEEYGPAEEYLLRAEELSPGERRILLETASLYENLERYDEAIERVGVLHEREPEDPGLNNFYGYLLAEKGERLELAEELVRRALMADPGNGYYLDSLGWIKYKQGDLERALDLLRGATEAVSDDPVIWEHLGDTYVALGQLARAAASYRRSLDAGADSSEVRRKLERLEGAEETTE